MKIIISLDKKTAWVIYPSGKTMSYYHSEGNVMDMVKEMVFEPIRIQTESEEITQIIELKSFV